MSTYPGTTAPQYHSTAVTQHRSTTAPYDARYRNELPSSFSWYSVQRSSYICLVLSCLVLLVYHWFIPLVLHSVAYLTKDELTMQYLVYFPCLPCLYHASYVLVYILFVYSSGSTLCSLSFEEQANTRPT